LFAIAAAIALVVLSVGTAEAARPATGVLMSEPNAVGWDGKVARANVPPGEIPECAATTCDRFDLAVDLPRGAWVRKTGGVEVSIRWGGVGNNLGLYVYRGGKRVAASDQGIAVATAASVLIPEAADGTYSVYAAFDRSSADDRIFYQGVAEVERPPKAKPARPLLPDLVTRPQRNPTFQTPFLDFYEPLPPPGESCFPSEAAEEGAQTCLRFDTLFGNVGEGPLEMRFAIPRDPASDARTISQRIYRSDGTFEERSGGQWEFHNAHGHYHYTAFGLSRLWATDGTGARVGPEPIRTGDKVSFCMIDTDLEAFGVKGNGPRTYHATDCLAPTESDADNDYLVQGMTPGWGDLYDWFLPDQYIEVSGLPDGDYILDTTTDPGGLLTESDTSNNCASVVVRLTNMGTPARHAEILGTGPACVAS
jgi:hypothetical protein